MSRVTDDLLRPRRIHVIGGPGSGKTTLARRLTVCLSAPSFDLDAVGYVSGVGIKRPLEDRLVDVRVIATNRSWVTEGIFLWWIDELLEAADMIVWLDVPWRVAAWRDC